MFEAGKRVAKKGNRVRDLKEESGERGLMRDKGGQICEEEES